MKTFFWHHAAKHHIFRRTASKIRFFLNFIGLLFVLSKNQKNQSVRCADCWLHCINLYCILYIYIIHKFCQSSTHQNQYTMSNHLCPCLISPRRRIFTVIGVLLSVIIISCVEHDVVDGFTPIRPLTTIRIAKNNNKIIIGSSSSPSSLKANNLVPIDDSNYRELFRGEKFLLLDAFAPW